MHPTRMSLRPPPHSTAPRDDLRQRAVNQTYSLHSNDPLTLLLHEAVRRTIRVSRHCGSRPSGVPWALEVALSALESPELALSDGPHSGSIRRDREASSKRGGENLAEEALPRSPTASWLPLPASEDRAPLAKYARQARRWRGCGHVSSSHRASTTRWTCLRGDMLTRTMRFARSCS